jgi:hypothetical protein
MNVRWWWYSLTFADGCFHLFLEKSSLDSLFIQLIA